MCRVMVIAECCSNILPATPDRIRRFANAAMHAGADALKIQLFLAQHFPEAERHEKARVEFPREMLPRFVEIAKDEGLLAGASVFDIVACTLLKLVGGDFIKLAAREEKNEGLRLLCSRSGLPILRSIVWTGATRVVSRAGEMTLACIPM